MVTSLYFLRHGQADRSEWTGDDFQRPLTARGKQMMQRGVQTLTSMDIGLNVILTSPLIRALQTAEIVAEALGMQDRLVSEDRLAPGFGVSELSALLKERAGMPALMLVGHEPDFSNTISALIGGGRVVCKKGGLARVDLFEGGRLDGQLMWLVPPSFLML